MINFDNYTNENKTEHNLKWPYIPDDPYRILIVGGSGSGKTNILLNLIISQSDIDKIYLYAKDPYEAKGTKKCVIKRILKFNDYKNCLLNNEVILEPQQRLKCEEHNYILKKLTRLH